MAALIKILIKAAALNALKKKGELVYLKTLNVVRRALRMTFVLVLVSQVMLCGLAMMIYSAFQLLPLNEVQMLYGMLGVGAAFFLLPLIFFLIATSDRTWFKAS